MDLQQTTLSIPIQNNINMIETDNSKKTQLILPKQQAAFDRITAIGRIVLSLDRKQFPLSVRTNTLITGESGAGKSFLVRAAAQELEFSMLSITTSEWMLLGSAGRGAAPTWPRIHEFLMRCTNLPGGIILLDELDKICDKTSWTTYLRSEAFMLLDLTVPTNLVDRDGDAISEARIEAAQRVLRSKILVIGAGAFQSIWDDRQRPEVGFLSAENRITSPDMGDLFRSLPREILARFGSNIIALPSLVENDYFQMLDVFADQMPDFWKPRFTKLGRERIPEAARLKLGPRFCEELVLEMVLAERQEIANFKKDDRGQSRSANAGIDSQEEYEF